MNLKFIDPTRLKVGMKVRMRPNAELVYIEQDSGLDTAGGLNWGEDYDAEEIEITSIQHPIELTNGIPYVYFKGTHITSSGGDVIGGNTWTYTSLWLVPELVDIQSGWAGVRVFSEDFK